MQIEQLTALGVALDRIYFDRGFSGTRRTSRAGLDQALAAVWPGSVFTVTTFDRFARDVADAHTILTDLSARGVRLGLGGWGSEPRHRGTHEWSGRSDTSSLCDIVST